MTYALMWFAVIMAVAIVAIAVISLRGRRALTTPEERAVHATLHTASLAARPLRTGLDAQSAAEAAPHLRALMGADALGVSDADATLLTWNGQHEELIEQF